MPDTYHALASDLHDTLADMGKNQQFWLGIVGAPGSGKSTLSSALCQEFGDESVVVPMDGYHLYRSQLDAMSNAAEAHRRRGAPFTFDSQRFVGELNIARRKGTGTFPSFQHGIGDPTENTIRLDAAQHRLVIVEGNYLLLDDQPWCQLGSFFDETWFLKVDLGIIRERLKNRFIAGGMSETAASERAEYNDIQNAKLIDQQSRQKASRIVVF